MPRNTITGLTDKEELFISEYILLLNARKAAVAAGYSPRSARHMGSQVLNRMHVRDEINKRLAGVHVAANELLRMQSDIARADIGDFLKISKDGFTIDLEEACEMGLTRFIKRIKAKKTVIDGKKNKQEIRIDEIELYPADMAQERLMRTYGLFRDLPVKSDAIGIKFELPARVLASSFLDVYRDIENKKHTEYVFSGGRGSTKSSFISLAIIYLIKNNPTMHALALRQVADTLRTSVYSQLQWAIGELGLTDEFKSTINPMELEYIPTGQKIYFRGGDDVGKIKSFKPPFGYIGILWLAELDQFRGQESVRRVEQSTLRGGDDAYIFKDFNPPPTKNNWANKYLTIPKDTQYQHKSTYLDVPPDWLGRAWIDEAEHLKNVNPDAYANEYLGLPTNDGGMVFNNVQIRAIADEEIKQFDNVLRGQDWGFYPDPASFGLMHYDTARRTLYIYGEHRGWKLSNKELFTQLIDNGMITEIETLDGVSYPDMIIADSAEPKSVGDFRAYGANCRGAEKGPESRKYSYKWLQGLTAIVIDNVRAPYHAEEFLNCEYERTKDGEIISEYPSTNDHAIDDVRYGTNLIWRRKGE